MINWPEIYGAFDGNMPECEGAACPKKCYKPRKTMTTWQGEKTYFTSLLDESELDFQNKFNPSLRKLGIQVEAIDVEADVGTDLTFLVSGCLDSKHGCKLQSHRPLACRMYPFRATNNSNPIDQINCPRSREIAANREIIKKILHVRKIFGFNDSNGAWLKSIRNFRADYGLL